MLIAYLRSSSMGSHDICPFKFYLSYVLGIADKTNWKADLGNMVHKALELLSQKKVCEQNKLTEFTDAELKETFSITNMTIELACEKGFYHYKKKNLSKHDWTEEHLERIKELVNYTLNYNNNMFSPANRNILAPEQFFDFPIEEPWAYYEYIDPHTKEKVTGQLRIKGTIDLVTLVSPGVIEYIDWKTGKRKDWATDKEKDYKKLRKDPQLMLYFYALTKLYPEYENIFVTIFFCQDGGPFTICFDRKRDIPYVLSMLKNKFEKIKNDQNPKRIWDNPKDRYRVCKAWCGYGKTIEENGKSQCENLGSKLQQLGITKMTQAFGKQGVWSRYADGGGQSNRE